METDDKGIRIEQGHSILADVQARELELERVLDGAKQEAGARIERAKAQAAEQALSARDEISRRKKEKAAAILDGAKAEAEAIRRGNKDSLAGLRARIETGIPRAVEEAVRAILPDGFTQ